MNPQNNSYKEKNLDFLNEYGKRSDVKVLHNGIMYRELTKGKGEKPAANSYITVHYVGKLINGKLFDATPQGRPATFKLSELIVGWRIALKEMPTGARWEIVVPYNLGYGSKASGVIKPFSTLIFDIRLLSVS